MCHSRCGTTRRRCLKESEHLSSSWYASQKNEEEILDRLMAEKVMQMFHLEVQQYVREKEPKDPDEAAELVVRYFKLKNIEEHKYERC